MVLKKTNDAEAEAPILTELKMLSVPPGAPALVAFVDVQSLCRV